MNPVAALRTHIDRRFQRWLERKLPAERTVHLDRRRIFIFPSRTGLGFLLMVALLWLMATNYENNLIFGFAALLTAVFVVAIFHSYANLAGLDLSVARVSPTFAGDKARVELRLGQSTARHRDAIHLAFAGASPVTVAVTGEATSAVLHVPGQRRGWLTPGRLTVTSYYPLGLLRVWTHVLPQCRGIVYPRPIPGQPAAVTGAGGSGPLQGRDGSEDFAGLEKYRPGESLSHVAWKPYAQGRGMYSKRYADPVSERLWLDWAAFPGFDREARLSRLCHWLLALSAGDTAYGLRLPGIEIAPDRGEGHRDRLLRELALFEVPEGGS